MNQFDLFLQTFECKKIDNSLVPRTEGSTILGTITPCLTILRPYYPGDFWNLEIFEEFDLIVGPKAAMSWTSYLVLDLEPQAPSPTSGHSK